MTLATSPVRAWCRLALLVVLTLVLLAPYALCFSVLPRLHFGARRLWSKGVCALLGLKVRVTGTPCHQGLTVNIANHVSYLDIPVLSSLVDAVFVAKNDVAEWPIVGQITRWGRTVYINRTAIEARNQSQHLGALLAADASLILFPEGTSTDGLGVAPFKTSLLRIVERPPDGTAVMIQPISITYARYADGTPLQGELTSFYCWYADATLWPHMKRILGLKGAEVEVRFHPPIRADGSQDRKQLARACHAAIAAGVAASHGLILGSGQKQAV